MKDAGRLYEKLHEYGRSDHYPMHMPGHKRNTEQNSMENPYGWDITEIDGFDDLHEPEGILKDSMEAASRLYGADRSWFLINGSTAGILAGITACTKPGDRILVARNCHKSVYHAMVLNQLEPVYLYPTVDPRSGILAGIDPIDVDAALRKEQEADGHIALVVITSPTYEGIISDVQTIAGVCHRYQTPFLVDEAHGAHLSSGMLYGSCFPEGAVSCGADLVVHSLHKTLPSLTQTGLLHQRGTLVDPGRVKHCLDIYQTSSPSYVLMASIDRCVDLLRREHRSIFGSWSELLQFFYRETRDLKTLSVITLDSCENFFAWDPSKLVISLRGSGHTGRELMTILRTEYRIEAEMASADYMIAMTGAGDRMEGVSRLARALREIDTRFAEDVKDGEMIPDVPDWHHFRGETEILPWRADRMTGEPVGLDRGALGRVCLEFVFAYPPGIPILVPGEKITEEVLQIVEAYEKSGIPMRGYEDGEGHKIRVAG